MKLIKKYLGLIITISVVVLVVIVLFQNKKKLDDELKAMQEYSSVVPVEITTPTVMRATQTLVENGTLRSGAEISILSETTGKVISVAGEVGQRVTAGQILVTVEKEVLESQYRLARTNLENAEKDLTRYDQLAGGEAITGQQLEAAKLQYQQALTQVTVSKKQLENTTLRSPMSGVISKRSVEEGAFLMPSVPVFSILEQNRMMFTVKVTERDVLVLTKGQKAEITLDALPGKVFTGNIHSMGVAPDLSGRYEVTVSLMNNDSLLRDGMSGKAAFENPLSGAEGIVIPRKCIVGSVRDARVFALQGDEVVSRRIKATSINENEVLVTEGLSSTDKVVLSGQINLEDGSKVKVINR